ncbi:MAG TPA: single-stranded DNA-binding protein [Clostridiales bacterium]|nr:single-stranded DNA-binding protein [Clostridiales bacterium]
MSEDNNRVIVSGKVVNTPILDHTLYGEEFYTFDISIPRLSGTVDVLPLTVSNRLMGNRLPEVGNHITVKGQLRSYNKQIDGVNRLIITIFAKQFRYEPTDYDYINDIELKGYICKPVIYRTTPFMREIADILIAVNRSYGKSDYLPCIAWGRNAHFAGSLDVGSVVRLEGRVQSRVYQKQLSETEIVERTAYEVSCSILELLPTDTVIGRIGERE